MEKEIRSIPIKLSKFDYALLVTFNIFLFFLLNRNEKYLWVFFAIIPLAFLVYRKPQLLLASTVQISGVFKFFLDGLNYSSISRSIMIFGLIFGALLFIKGLNKNILVLLKQPLFILVSIFSILWLMSLSYTPTPRYGEQKVVLHILYNLPLLLQFVIFNLDIEDYNTFFKFVIFFTLLFALNSFIYFLQFGLQKDTNLNYFVINRIWVCRLYGVGIIAASFCWHTSDNYKKKYYLLAGLLFLVFMILLGKRGPILSLIMIFGLMYLFRKKTLFKKDMYIFIPIILFILFFLLYWKQFFENLSAIAGIAGSKQLSVLYRVQMFQLFTKVLDSITITGLGAGSFSKLAVGQDLRWYPHNIFVETLLEIGILGSIILVLIIYVQLREFLELRRNHIDNPRKYEVILHSASIFYYGLLNAQFSGDLFTNRYIWVGLGLHLSLMLKERTNSLTKQDNNF